MPTVNCERVGLEGDIRVQGAGFITLPRADMCGLLHWDPLLQKRDRLPSASKFCLFYMTPKWDHDSDHNQTSMVKTPETQSQQGYFLGSSK